MGCRYGQAVGSPFRGHSSWVTSVAVSSDCELIFSGSADGTIQPWRAKTGEAIEEPLCDYGDGSIWVMALSKDDKYIVSATLEGEIRLSDAWRGEAIGLPYQVHKERLQAAASAVAVSREGKIIFSGHGDGTVRQWDVSAQENVSEEHSPLAVLDEMPRISCVNRSARGKFAVSVSEDNVVQKWDTSTDEAVGHSVEGGGAIAEDAGIIVAISKDGSLVVSCGNYEGTVQRWDASAGDLLANVWTTMTVL